jgi:hypothetical protein
MKKLVTAVMVTLLMTASVAWAAEPPKMKMTTEIPEGITTSDKIETRLGTLNFFDGVPDEETTQKVYNYLDFQYAPDRIMVAMVLPKKVIGNACSGD